MRTLLVFVLGIVGVVYGVDSRINMSSCASGQATEQPLTSEEEALNFARCHVACVDQVRRKLCVCVSVCCVNYNCFVAVGSSCSYLKRDHQAIAPSPLPLLSKEEIDLII